MEINIRKLAQKDLKNILAIVHKTGMFTKEEEDVAMEVVEASLIENNKEGYSTFCAVDHKDSTIGFISFGKRSLADRVYDIYWMAVDPSHQRKGIGTALLKFCEDDLKMKKARMALIETSSQDKYNGTREFYLKLGYSLAAEIIDFYSDGDNMTLYLKRF